MDLKSNIKLQKHIQSRIALLEDELNELKLEETLILLGSQAPILVPSCDNIKKYKYLSKNHKLHNLGINLIPVWLKLECIHPKWTTDYIAINIIKYEDHNSGKGYEILVNGLKDVLGISYKEVKEFIKIYNLTIPTIYTYEHTLGSNIIINFSESKNIEPHEYQNYKYHLKITDDMDMVINTVNVKFILILPIDIQDSFYFSGKVNHITSNKLDHNSLSLEELDHNFDNFDFF